MTTFLLIRHGHTDWIGKALAGHTPGVKLSAEGREQASRLAELLADLPVTALYSSPLERTRETAGYLSERWNLPVQLRSRLMEVDFGEWTGRTLDDLQSDPLWQRFNSQRSTTRAPGGDLMLDVQARMTEELQELSNVHPNETVAVVSHQDSIKAAISHYLGMPLDLFLRFEIHPASYSVIHLADWGPRVISLNTTAGV